MPYKRFNSFSEVFLFIVSLKNFFWKIPFKSTWSVEYFNTVAIVQDGIDIHGFSNRKWPFSNIQKLDFSVLKSMSIHCILQFDSNLSMQGRLWKCREHTPTLQKKYYIFYFFSKKFLLLEENILRKMMTRLCRFC